MNRTLMERVRSMLNAAKLKKSFWGEALNTACYLINRSPTISLELKTPEEIWCGKPADYSFLRVFGCDVYAWVPRDKRTKLDMNSKRCIFLGYEKGVKGYRLWDPTAHKIIISRDVVFNEDSLLGVAKQQRTTNVSVEQVLGSSFETVDGEIRGETSEFDPAEGDSHHVLEEDVEVDSSIEKDSHAIPYQLRRKIVPPARFDDYVTSFKSHSNCVSAYVALADEHEPTSFKEASDSISANKWRCAMEEEMESLYKNNTWELVQLPKGRKAIGCRWVYKIKKDPEGNIERFKARLVVKGYAQKPGIDFDEVFSPVVRLTTIRVVLAIAAVLDLELEQLDVKTAFLHGDLDEEIFMTQMKVL
ncbi:hypothetical protein Syun_007713 [Stephania yunnanensis]|uniref:Reverse transcriptase Ty1/copia-type domain-containing protein n=1 Tax=Stephania yunnanensis TaxID=152371 RepID=A0AAP0L0N7_9MAGN